MSDERKVKKTEDNEIANSKETASNHHDDPIAGNNEEDDAGVTMVDVLEDEQNLEEDAKAVLGAADDKNCTYHFGGYMKRQALYSCLSCSVPKDPDFKPAGICLACTYHCHEGHDIVELYTKRNFRCDCGNRRLAGACKLANDKDGCNVGNRYNQNFSGTYCTCLRPYPDAEDPVADSMIQCVMCEDWFHGRHLKKTDGADSLPSDDCYSEMVCHICHEKFHDPFLFAYIDCSVNGPKSNDTEEAVDVETNNEGEASAVAGCVLDRSCDQKGQTKEYGALFMTNGWREKLCKCEKCTKLYSELDVEFLCSDEDTVHHYEAKAKDSVGSQYENGMKALSEMDRFKQVEAIQGYNSMKSDLMEYLKKFADNGKVVREEDIQEFFQEMKANKRQKVEIPKFCK